MPGAYAHLTLVNFASESARLEKIGMSDEAIAAAQKNLKFLELGAVSPDYPYLVPANSKAAAWADLMHYADTGKMIVSAIESIREKSGKDRDKAFAWLLGYAAHVGGDLTIHPVVEKKVGNYADHKADHRKCEMHQDVYIFQRLNVGKLELAEHLDDGIWACCDAKDSGRLEGVVLNAWNEALKRTYPKVFAENPPDINSWHKSFKFVVDKVEEGGNLYPFARHVAVSCGWCYPASKDIDKQFIEGLATPEGTMNYDQIFDRAIENVLTFWKPIESAIYSRSKDYLELGTTWNLDTGRDKSGKLLFWSER